MKTCPYCKVYIDDEKIYHFHIKKCCHRLHKKNMICAWCSPSIGCRRRKRAVEKLIDKWLKDESILEKIIEEIN